MYLIVTLALLISYSRDVSATPTITDLGLQSGWYSPPNIRSTTEILWSCLTTLFICLWATLHLNVPAASDGQISPVLRKIKWMLIGLITPEIPPWFAVHQWYLAWSSSKQMRRLGFNSWTITHAFYAGMGGFVVKVKGSSTIYTLDTQDIRFLVVNGVLLLPDISEGAIRDKSKADSLGKAIACIQASWLAIQCCARSIQRLPTSTLELATLGYVLCALITYAFWWYKPLDVMLPTEALKSEKRTDEGLLDLIRESSKTRNQNFWHIVEPLDRISNWRHYKDQGRVITLPLAILIVLVFGGIHYVAWSFNFASQVEQLLWRVSAALITALGPVIMVLNDLIIQPGIQEQRVKRAILSIVLCAVVTSYIVGRAYLIVEPFLSLRSVPVGVYQSVDWIAFLPHL